MRKSNRLSGWQERLIDGLAGLASKLGKNAESDSTERMKFVGYHDLLKVMEKPSCPACFIVRRSLQGYLGVAFIEELTSPEFREPLRASFGYCEEHSDYVKAAARNRLKKMGIAIVYEDVLARVQDFFRRHHAVPLVANCPLCKLQDDVNAYVVRLIADYCGDSEFQKHYAASAGVCLPHYRSIARLLTGDAREFFLDDHRKKLSALLGHLQEFIRKYDYRFSHEKMTNEETHSWKNAVRFIVGEA